MRRFLTLTVGCAVFAISSSVSAQVVPDRTLPNNSVVSDELEITGGTRAGNNLFHSFREFSVNAGETAFFNNNLAIENIIGRVTGNSASMIDGLIRSLGDANLFLINPNGIIFGEGAALDVGGSFIGSTANSIQFSDGTQFSAVAPDTEALLTVSIPVGLQYGTNPEDITVQGTGNNLSIVEDVLVDRSDRPVGLEVSRGNTLALIGGDVFLPGGNLTAAEGKVAIGSVAGSGMVKLTPDAEGWNFNYDEVAAFGNIDLSQAASVEVSGNGGGEVRFQGRAISLSDGSAILADTSGDSSGKVLELSATESVELVGSAANNFPTRLSTDVYPGATGDGGNLLINTDYLLVADGAEANSNTYGFGNGGNLTVRASEIEVIGFLVLSDEEFSSSGLFAQSDIEDTGDAGDLLIETDSMLVAEGAEISTTTFGSGDGGNLTVNASSVEVIDGASLSANAESSGDGGNLQVTTDSLFAGGAQIAVSTFGSGDGGNLTVNASLVEVIDGAGLFANAESSGDGGNLQITTDSLFAGGAQISVSTFGSGDGGNLTVNASSVELVSAGLFANVESSGNGGSLQIVTDSLLATEGAQISVSTFGSGDGGNLTVNASSVELIGAGLFTSVEPESSGDGGNLQVVTEQLVATEGAEISTSTLGSGNGGNINIEGNELLISEGAQILASTRSTGDAGNININSEQIELTGTSPNGFPSSIFANVIESSGDGGNIAISTSGLNLTQGAQIATSTSGSGDGGNLEVSASDFMFLNGTSETGASGLFANAVLRDGNGGDITVNTNSLLIADGATINAGNFPSDSNSPLTPGEGAAGNVNITAPNIVLDGQATVTANTVTGDRGNISFQTDLLILRRASEISTDAGETATGGNINIDASNGFIIAVPQENSDITANAVLGDGGNITINVQELFGIQRRDSLTPFSDITASSEFGIAGNVVLNTQDLNPTEETTELPNAPKPPELAQGCQTPTDDSSFVNLNQGGINSQPSDALGANELIGDVQLPRQWSSNNTDSNEVVEAQGWVVNERGNVALVADVASQSEQSLCRLP